MFKKLDEVMKPGAMLYSNTPGIDIDIMANATKRPQDVAGTHFFAPANVMKLFEVVKGTKSAPDDIGDGDGSSAARSARSAHCRQWRRVPRQSQPRSLRHGDGHPGRGRRIARADRQGDGRLRLSGRPVCGVGYLGARYRLRHAGGGARADSELPQDCRSPTASSRSAGSARRPMPAGIATKRATAPRSPIRKSRA